MPPDAPAHIPDDIPIVKQVESPSDFEKRIKKFPLILENDSIYEGDEELVRLEINALQEEIDLQTKYKKEKEYLLKHCDVARMGDFFDRLISEKSPEEISDIKNRFDFYILDLKKQLKDGIIDEQEFKEKYRSIVVSGFNFFDFTWPVESDDTDYFCIQLAQTCWLHPQSFDAFVHKEKVKMYPRKITCSQYFELFGMGTGSREIFSKIAGRDVSDDIFELDIQSRIHASTYSPRKNKITLDSGQSWLANIAYGELLHKYLFEAYPRLDHNRLQDGIASLHFLDGEKREMPLFSPEYIQKNYETNTRKYSKNAIPSCNRIDRIAHEGFADMYTLLNALKYSDYENARSSLQRIIRKTPTLSQFVATWRDNVPSQTYRLCVDLITSMLDVKVEGRRLSDGSIMQRQFTFKRLAKHCESSGDEYILYGKTRQELIDRCQLIITQLHTIMEKSIIDE